MTRNSERTAAKAYAARRTSIDAKLAQLKSGLRAHHRSAARRPDDWGFAGDLGRVEELIDEMLSFLGVAGMEAQ